MAVLNKTSLWTRNFEFWVSFTCHKKLHSFNFFNNLIMKKPFLSHGLYRNNGGRGLPEILIPDSNRISELDEPLRMN